MIKFPINVCPKCGRRAELMISNNPLSGTTICFDCIHNNLDQYNIEHGEFFCRTYNLPWKPDLWLKLAEDKECNIFREYTLLMLLNSFITSVKKLFKDTIVIIDNLNLPF